VDPEGKLFWSHGIDCVHGSESTPIDDRHSWFQDFPGDQAAFADCFSTQGHVAHGYYQGRQPRCFDFARANLKRKYGEDWFPRFTEVTQRRLRSWGLNTIANWSDPRIYLLRRTPYTATVSFYSKPIQGSTGYWGQFKDPFEPEFRRRLGKALAAVKDRSAKDPWCVGFFVDNEIGWGDEVSLAVAALASPPDQAAKKAFLDDLRVKYETIDQLNEAWGTKHLSWEALGESRQPPAAVKARADLTAFYTKTAEQYFRTVRECVKETAPDLLYLGCRFAWVNDRAVAAAVKFCDVVSYNLYRGSVADFRIPGRVDVPLIIGEFHFGALDRGMFHTGLVSTANQAERARTYEEYVKGALGHPQFVGTHWFQYMDQATTGRPLDGENYQIGFVDSVDTPYPEIVAASRRIGQKLYQIRLGRKPW
jgi:hypothetical protein